LFDFEAKLMVVVCLLGVGCIAISAELLGSTYRAAMGQGTVLYGCEKKQDNIHCDPVHNKFDSFLVHGEAQEVYRVTPSSFSGVSAKYGNGLQLKGYVGEFLTIPNNLGLSPNRFSVALWAKQDPDFDLDGTIISHKDRRNTAGWYLGTKVKPTLLIQFSIANNRGEVFTISSAIDKDRIEFIAGTFDGMTVKLYLNGILANETKFSGIYKSDPEGPFNIGVDSFDHTNAWKGVVDDVRFFNRVLSESEIKDIMNGTYQSVDGLEGYWPFDNSTGDISGRNNDGLLSSQAVSMAFSPDGRLFFTEKNLGEVRILKDDKPLSDPFIKLTDLHVAQHQGLLGITLDPKFDTNHFVYVYYTSNGSKTGVAVNKVVRFTEVNNKATDEIVLLDDISASTEGEFAGGALRFGLDDKLYVSTGHANSVVLPQNMSSLIGKVLRINRDGTLPSDNPFPNSPIYTLGHRNVFGIAFDKKNGLGIVTENGDAHYDEINILKKGGNYGFATSQPPTRSPLLDNSSSIKPVRVYWETIAPTQAIFYDGDKFPELKDKLLFGSYNEGFIYALGLNETGSVTDELAIEFPYDDNVDSIVQSPSPSGDIYFGGYNIYKVSSINMENPEQTMYFIQISHNNSQVSNLQFDLEKAILSFDAKSTNNQSDSIPPSLQVRIPRALLGSIIDVYTSSSRANQGESVIDRFDIEQQYRTARQGDIVIDITLNKGLEGPIEVKGVHNG
jgi:glucose/arabinose dehydrogenase